MIFAFSHPFSGLAATRRKAIRWAAAIVDAYPDALLLADWLWLTQVWSEVRKNDGLAQVSHAIVASDYVIRCGPGPSEGCDYEASLGIPTIDLRYLGETPPAREEIRRAIDVGLELARRRTTPPAHAPAHALDLAG
jgi:hypothetical protein